MLCRGVQDDRWARRAHGAAGDAGRHAGAERPPATRQALRIDATPLEQHDHDQREADQPRQDLRGERGQHPHAHGRSGHGAEREQRQGLALHLAPQRHQHAQ
jgi:hypothetical protein